MAFKFIFKNALIIALVALVSIGGGAFAKQTAPITFSRASPTRDVRLPLNLEINGNLDVSGTLTTGTAIAPAYGGTGLSFLGTANQVLGINAEGTGLEYKNLSSFFTAGPNISLTTDEATDSLTIATSGIPTGGGTPNYLARWTSHSSLGNSGVYEDPVNQRIGVGTTTPEAKLHVSGGDILLDNNRWLMIKDVGGRIRNVLQMGGNDKVALTSAPQNDLVLYQSGPGGNILFYTNDAEVMRINNSGNVGVGTTAPKAKLDLGGGDDASDSLLNLSWGSAPTREPGVKGLVRFGQLGQVDFELAQSTGNLRFREYHYKKELLAINASGNIGVGTTSPTNILTVVQGSPTDPVADAWTTYSSTDYKQDITRLAPVDYQKMLESLKKLDLVTYRMKGASESAKPYLGIIAEESPELVLSEDNKSTNLYAFTSYTLGGLKALTNQVEFLEKKVLGNSTKGKAILPAGETKTLIETSAVASDSAIFVTPETLIDVPLTVTNQEPNTSFTVEIAKPQEKEVKFRWLIVN